MRVLDLFCGAGGASMGYHRAGFDVVGVDIAEQPEYPFAFVRGDALSPPVRLDAFDLIHASPPCQAYTTMSNRWRGAGGVADERADLIPPTRALLESSGVPWVIENVRGSRLDGFTLTGEMFGLGVHRPRLFETSWFLLAPQAPPPSRTAVGVYGKHHDGRELWTRKDGSQLRAPKTLAEGSEAMGIDWMYWHGLKEAIPPAYTEWLGSRVPIGGAAPLIVSSAQDNREVQP